ncbi:Nuclear envelope phosphatase-regulatory subunit 1 [Frankliniella fusca]|uniref:Transmembrane protein 188 n=1 Tax=Frankliniella fusca TaxID=407009 RepID=A0AAE1HFR2_9NEOP|nr:Nuclear envelope phosphatase-regulatory subunit 1 [Frankliniella fusca]KAK3924739.1 Nuclear envelope phosphatase-regulatory subunit 1 [Frankliniella fusca]
MSLEQTACEDAMNPVYCLVLLSDLKAFERRLTEVISCLQPSTTRWRILLAVVSICTAVGAWHWLTDPNTSEVSFTQSLFNNPFFTISSIILVFLFVLGIHKRVIAPSIITTRTRQVLTDFNMSCDDTGKLILKPRPTTT